MASIKTFLLKDETEWNNWLSTTTDQTPSPRVAYWLKSCGFWSFGGDSRATWLLDHLFYDPYASSQAWCLVFSQQYSPLTDGTYANKTPQGVWSQNFSPLGDSCFPVQVTMWVDD